MIGTDTVELHPAQDSERLGTFSNKLLGGSVNRFYKSGRRKLNYVVGCVGAYDPSTHFRSFQARSVNLATLFLGKPPMQFTST